LNVGLDALPTASIAAPRIRSSFAIGSRFKRAANKKKDNDKAGMVVTVWLTAKSEVLY
jgi:hypothetical protein